jgi:hypothetical protein
MAEIFAPFIINRTIRNLTFYSMDGRNFVRTKSSLTRRKVLYSPNFALTRHNASLMAQASKIGSYIYNSLPVHWRQFWMYRSFTGEAYTMLKKRKDELEIRQLLLDRYVKEVLEKQGSVQPALPEPTKTKRTYRKLDTRYWERKTQKSIRRKARIQQRQRYSCLLAEASKIASKLYSEMPAKSRKRSHYQKLTGWVMKRLKEQEDEHIRWENEQQKKTGSIGYISCKKGICYFIPPCIPSTISKTHRKWCFDLKNCTASLSILNARQLIRSCTSISSNLPIPQ